MGSIYLPSQLIRIGLLLLFGLLSIASSRGQGYLLFSTRVPGINDAPIYFGVQGGPPPPPGFTAQLLAGPAGASLDLLAPVHPTTPFRTGTTARAYYVEPIVVELGLKHGQDFLLYCELTTVPPGKVHQSEGNPTFL
jgi:hypothetical protein